MGLFNLHSRYLWLFVLLFAIGATSRFDLTLIARIPVSELIAFAALPLVLRGVPFSRFSHRIWPVVGILALWALSILISDFVNGFNGGRFIRAFAKPVWCLLWMLFFIGVLYKDFRAILLYPAGAILAAIQNYFAPQSWTEDRIASGGYDAVAYGLAPALTAVFLLLATLTYQKGRLYAAFFFASNATVLLFVGAPRNTVVLMLLNSLCVFYVWWTRRSGGKVFRLTMKRLAVLAVLAFASCFLIYEAYAYAAIEGWLGEFQQLKFLGQSNTIFGDSFLGLIVSGRAPVFGAILAIMDEPFWGTGSWTSWMMSDYYYDAIAIVGTRAEDVETLAQTGNIRGVGHSILFAAWLENGLIAAISLLMIGYIVLKEFLAVLQKDSRMAPLLIYFATAFFWAFIFSPFGVLHRLIIGLFFAFHVMHFHQLKVGSTGAPSSFGGSRLR